MAEGRAVIMAFQSHRQFSSARTHTADEYSMGRSACAAGPQVQEYSSASASSGSNRRLFREFEPVKRQIGG